MEAPTDPTMAAEPMTQDSPPPVDPTPEDDTAPVPWWFASALDTALRQAGEIAPARLQQILELATRELGCSSIAVAGRDGLVIAHRVPRGTDPRTAAALAASILNSASDVARDLRQAEVRQVIIDSTDGRIVAMAAGTDAIVLAIYERDADLAPLQLRLDHVAETVRSILEEL